MRVTKSMLEQAVKANVINDSQLTPLLQFLRHANRTHPQLTMTNVLYYLGGMVAIGAMSIFMNLGWETFGGWGIFFIGLLYAGIGLIATKRFTSTNHLIAAGICATFVIVLTPLIIYGLQKGMGWWPDATPYRQYHAYIKWHWIFMELGTIAIGAALLWRYRFPFMLMPIAFTLWYMSMDLAPLIAQSAPSFSLRATISVIFGVVMIITAFIVDLRNRSDHDYAFWLYLFGVITFWGGLTSQSSNSELSKFIYCCINAGLIFIGVGIYRNVFVVFGAIGVAFYLGHLAQIVFKDSWLFPIALSAIGFSIIYLGILWQKHEKQLNATLSKYLPTSLQQLAEKRR